VPGVISRQILMYYLNSTNTLIKVPIILCLLAAILLTHPFSKSYAAGEITADSPINNTQTTDRTPTLSWNLVAPLSISSYEVHLGTDALTQPAIGTVPSTTTNFTPSTDLAVNSQTTYYWHIVGNISGGGTVTSEIESFFLVESVEGAGLAVPGLIITNEDPDTEIVKIIESSPVGGYGGGSMNIPNACIPDGFGFADVGILNNGAPETKAHRYRFSFTGNRTVDSFSVRVFDWGDFLPNGANSDQTYWIALLAYDIDDNLLAEDRITFTSTTSSINNRNTPEFGNLAVAGDACDAEEGQPGRGNLEVNASGIYRLELHYRDLQSMDPHSGFRFPDFNLEALPEDDSFLTPTGQNMLPYILLSGFGVIMPRVAFKLRSKLTKKQFSIH
jgi:hypothetical protein